jgi:1,4-dihydroxy-2-naphthoate polyprenyltransferase
MSINYGMWLTALQRPVKMKAKQEWDALDLVSKWLIATRGTVTQLTVYACVIAGLLAWRDGYFAWLPWVIITLGVYLAHSTENLLNDYIDYTRGIDEDNYYRAQYGVHPLVHKFWTKRDWLGWFLTGGILAALSGILIFLYTSFSPFVIGLSVIGALLILFYAYPLKYWGLGEIVIYVIWGLLIIPGVYIILARAVTPDLGNVLLTGLAFGLGFGSFNLGKHIDKLNADKIKGVGTLPVRLGEARARYVNIATLVLAYVVVLYLVFIVHFLTPVVLVVFFASYRAWLVIKLLSKPRPKEAPAGYPLWPRWFSTPMLMHIRLFGGLYILGLAADTLLRLSQPAFWR